MVNALTRFDERQRKRYLILFLLAGCDDAAISVARYWYLEDLVLLSRAFAAGYAYSSWIRGVLARNSIRVPCKDAAVDGWNARKMRTEARLLRAEVDHMGHHGNSFITYNKCYVAKRELEGLAAVSLDGQRKRMKRARTAMRSAKQDNLCFILNVVHGRAR